MRKVLGALVILTLVGALLAGCGGGGKPADSTNTPDNVPSTVDEETEEAVETALDGIAKDEWPAPLVPPGMPEWTGKILTWAEVDDELIIQLGDVTEENLGAYFDSLEAAGWTVSRYGLEGSASKGLSDAEFIQQGNTTVQLAIQTEKEGAWPSDELPPDLYPPENCTLVGDPYMQEEEEDSLYYFHFVCEGVDEAAAEAYLAGLEQEGWDGPGQYVKDIEWKGKTWTVDISLYDTYGTRSEFSVNMSAQ